MPHPSKRKGVIFERAIVNAARAADLEAKRAYASNGRSLGEHKNCDVQLGGLCLQCKRRKAVAEYLYPPEGCDATILRADRREALAVVPLDLLLDLLK